jgi:hypothetical protein
MIAAALIAAALGAGPGQCAEPVTRERRVERVAGARVVRTAVVACSSGRRVVVRRARWVDPAGPKPPRGRLLKDPAAAGGRVAWGEARRGPRRVVARVAVSRIRGARAEPPHERIVYRGAPRFGLPELRVVLTTRGEVAWLTGGRVWVARGEGRARVVARDAYFELELEDDRVLRWRRDAGVHFTELRPWRGPGCPRRDRYRVVAENAEIVVSEAFYADDLEENHVIRACVRATGDDPVLHQFVRVLDGDSGVVWGVSGQWVLLVADCVIRRDDCGPERILPIHAATRRRGRTALLSDPARSPQRGEPIVATAGGIPAWTVRDATRSAVLSAARDGSLVELDAAGPAGITGLVADGAAVRWLHDGVARSAVLDEVSGGP